MSLTTHHITSHSTGFPSLARVLAQKCSIFEPIHVTFCVCSFPIALLFWNVHLRGPLKVWNSQGSRCMGLCADKQCLQDASFVIFLLISNLSYLCAFVFSHHTHQWWFLIVVHPAATVYGKFRRGCLRKVFMKSGDMARSCKWRLSINNLHGHTPCVLHCIPSRATNWIIQHHHISDSRYPFSVYSSRRTCLFEAAHYSRPIILSKNQSYLWKMHPMLHKYVVRNNLQRLYVAYHKYAHEFVH